LLVDADDHYADDIFPDIERVTERSKIGLLTRREREVVLLFALGFGMAIAANMKFSDNIVRHHFSSIFDKFLTFDRQQALVCAFRHALAQPRTKFTRNQGSPGAAWNFSHFGNR